MRQRSNYSSLLLVALLLLFCCCETVSAARSKKQPKEDPDNELGDNIKVHFLVEMIGKHLYAYVNKPKYKFYIYMTVGSLPSEQSTIAFLSTICNVLYGILVWLGFLFLRRDYMLLGTILTLYIGPAVIFILIGAFGLTLAAFAIYPITSVLIIWSFYFLTSQIAQSLGQYLGLDSDKDGDVDFLDLLHWMASTRVGKTLGFPVLYEILSKLSRDPFQEIHKRLDSIMEQIETNPPPAQNNISKKNI